MHGRCIRMALAGALMVLLLGGCLSREHPNFARYEYLYIEGAFQPPYTEFPSGAERTDWLCYDGRVEREFQCTFVRGGWEFYQYIYRPRG